ncbi:MAG: hypothetical protein AAGC60_01620 [Acidobacteriota bacterium]
MTDRHLFYTSGVDGSTGAVSRPITSRQVVDGLAQRGVVWAGRGLPVGVDGDDLAQVGWALITDDGLDPAVLDALAPLLELRRQQAGRLYRDDIVYLRGRRRAHFFADLGLSPGPPDPEVLPYFVLIVGEPTGVPYRIEHGLDDERAVGRLAFDRVEDYARYARAVVQSETRTVTPTSVIFPIRHPDDRLTALSTDSLAHPVARHLEQLAENEGSHPPPRLVDADTATKSRLLEVLRRPPSLLLTSGHAARFPAAHRRQADEQGALLCADWPGPRRSRGPLMPGHLFAASDLPDNALDGLIAYFFACDTVGTPHADSFEPARAQRTRLALEPFVAALPKAMLAQPAGPALAVAGHVDQTFAPTYHWPGVGSRADTFLDFTQRLLRGERLGHALESFGDRAQQLATTFLETHDTLMLERNLEITDDEIEELAEIWMAYRDARSVSVLGDPAVRVGVIAPDA